MTHTNTDLSLDRFKNAAIRAHSLTSFSPERRGEQMIKEYSEELNEDIEELRKDSNVSEESILDYKERYEKFFSSYLSAKSRCFSVMITGGSNFPVRRHEKANRSEEKHYQIFREWRVRAKKAIVRKAQPVKTFVSELDRYKAELAGMKVNHEKMKEANKKIKSANINSEDLSEYLSKEFAIPPHMYDYTMRFGFGLQNNNANMKRVEQRIKEMAAKENMREESPVTNYTFEGGAMIINYEIDRIQILFTTRPTQSELSDWKAKGLNTFNWSPSAMAWQRKITPNALYCVKRMLTGITKIN